MIVRVALAATLVLGLLAGPSIADAQPAGKVPRIGYLLATSPTVSSRSVEASRQGLRGLGWVEGQNIVIEYRFAAGRYDRRPDLAADLVRLQVNATAASGTAATTAAKNATRTTPIVMIGAGDPVGLGLIGSLARPGGNVTGVDLRVTSRGPTSRCNGPGARVARSTDAERGVMRTEHCLPSVAPRRSGRPRRPEWCRGSR